MGTQTMRRTTVAVAMAMCAVGVSGTARAASPAPVKLDNSTGTQGVSTRSQGDGRLYPTELVNVRSTRSKCGSKPIAEASGRGKITLRIDETHSVSTTLSKNIKAEYKAISVGVGWDVTKSRSVTVSGSKEVPRGKYGVLKAYTRYSGKEFDVRTFPSIGGDIVQRNKKAYKPIGVCYKYSQH
ncbi:hypothetical protein ACWGJB_18210 [Streptomyces sp. NPDC054813]